MIINNKAIESRALHVPHDDQEKMAETGPHKLTVFFWKQLFSTDLFNCNTFSKPKRLRRMLSTENGNNTENDNSDGVLLSNEPLVGNGGERFSDEGVGDDIVGQPSSLDISSEEGNDLISSGNQEESSTQPWEPSGNRLRDMLYFVGPGELAFVLFELDQIK